MKLRNIIWFWIGIVFVLTAYDGISFLLHPRERYPEPATAILIWMCGALFPTFLFYVSGRIIVGMFPSHKISDSYLKFLFSGIIYIALFVITTKFPAPWEKILGSFTLFLGPIAFCFLLTKSNSILSASQRKSGA